MYVFDSNVIPKFKEQKKNSLSINKSGDLGYVSPALECIPMPRIVFFLAKKEGLLTSLY